MTSRKTYKADIVQYALPDKSKYARIPHIIMSRPHHATAGFTMRLLNFLYTVGMKQQASIGVPRVDEFARTHCPYPD